MLRPNTPAVALSTVRPLLGHHDAVGGANASLDDTPVAGVTHDSRDVRVGDLYCALTGASVHGADFLDAVVHAGAAALLTDERGRERCVATGLPTLVVPDVRDVMGTVAAHIYGEPARAMVMLGITGTNGKTTTAYMLDAALRAAGRRTGLIGTIETRIDNQRLLSVRTTPESTQLHALLAVMRDRGVEAVVMEVSSHALVMGRVDGVIFDVAGFLNLSQDHLDFHGDMEAYFAAKADLFTARRTRRAVVCTDDEWGQRLANNTEIPVTVLAGVGRRLPMGMHGDFNRQNAALAWAMAEAVGVDAETLARAFNDVLVVPGRMEQVVAAPGMAAYVDYAHTPEAIGRVLNAMAAQVQRGRVIVVMGAGGDRDSSKRPLMGAAAALQADVVIVTDDNPRSEDPAQIRAAVMAGAVAAGGRAHLEECGDRRTAIDAGVDALTQSGGVLLVLGKGHEQGQEVAGVVDEFDDRDVLRASWESRRASP